MSEVSNKTRAEDFIGSLTTAIAPNGNVFYLSAIGEKHLQLKQLKPVQWTYFFRTGDTGAVSKKVFPAGAMTFPIENSFFNKSLGKAFIEVPSSHPNMFIQAVLNKENFDLSPLNSLPLAAVVHKDAESKSSEANYVQDLENKSFLEKFLYSIFGMSWKTNLAIYGLGGLVAIIAIRKFLK
jgi:hypothetical protein